MSKAKSEKTRTLPHEFTIRKPASFIYCVAYTLKIAKESEPESKADASEATRIGVLTNYVFDMVIDRWNVKKGEIQECFETKDNIATRSGLGKTTIDKHLKPAVAAGFLVAKYKFTHCPAGIDKLRFNTEDEIRDAQSRLAARGKSYNFVGVYSPPKSWPTVEQLRAGGSLGNNWPANDAEAELVRVLTQKGEVFPQECTGDIRSCGDPSPSGVDQNVNQGMGTRECGPSNAFNEKYNKAASPSLEKNTRAAPTEDSCIEYDDSSSLENEHEARFCAAYCKVIERDGNLAAGSIELNFDDIKNLKVAAVLWLRSGISDPFEYIIDAIKGWKNSLGKKQQTIYTKHLSNPKTLQHLSAVRAGRADNSRETIIKTAKSRAAMNRALSLRDDKDFCEAKEKLNNDTYTLCDLHFWAERKFQDSTKFPSKLVDYYERRLVAREKGPAALAAFEASECSKQIIAGFHLAQQEPVADLGKTKRYRDAADNIDLKLNVSNETLGYAAGIQLRKFGEIRKDLRKRIFQLGESIAAMLPPDLQAALLDTTQPTSPIKSAKIPHKRDHMNGKSQEAQ